MKHVIAGAALAVFAAGCGGSSSGGSATVQPSGAATSATGACRAVPAAKPSPQHYASEPKLTIAKATYTAKIVTNCGTITLALDGKHAPHTVNSFVFLASKHYFDNTPCHRLTSSGIYVLQCGDPTGSGSGGPGYQFQDENLGAIKHGTYPTGIVAMANAGPNTNGSQFFLVYKNSPLSPNYTPFGRIISGLDVVQKIAAAGSNPPGDGAPKQPVVIESFTVKKG